ncbi:MAG: ADP-ribosylation factor-like protein [Candidatus Thorarchaeota archaeon]
MVKKKIPTKHRSFDSVLEEVEMFFRVRRKILAPGILRDVLVRIGLPTAKKIVTAKDIEAMPAKKEPEAPKPEPKTTPPIKEEASTTSIEAVPPEDAATFVENPELDLPGVTVLDGEDFTNITDALNAVESMSDTFMAARPKSDTEPLVEEEDDSERPSISINVAGSDEIISAPTTFASTPQSHGEEEAVEAIEPEPTSEIDDEPEVAEPVPEAEEPEPVEVIDVEDEPAPHDVVPEPPAEAELETELVHEIEQEAEAHVTEVEAEELPLTSTPAHVVKPLIQSKILILGEAGVGKRSLMRKAELDPIEEDAPGGEPFVHTKLVETENHRVRVSVWSFDEAVKSKISRKDFYDEAEALIIVYAASDRWSFESIEFWLKEATITTDVVPPIVVVSNKTDLVGEFEEDAGDKPVTSEEGFALAEQLAERFSSEEKLHPVAYIGTSCLTGEGVFDVFITSAELAARHRPAE